MSAPEFLIPQTPQDLESDTYKFYGLHSVTSFEDSGTADEAIDLLTDKVLNARDIFSTLLEHSVFDKLYSLIKWWSGHSGATKRRVIELLSSLMQEILASVAEVAGNETASTPTVPRRSAFRAAAWLLAEGVKTAEKTTQSSDLLDGGKPRSSKAVSSSARSRAAAVAHDGLSEEEGEDRESASAHHSWEWSGELRNSCVSLLQDVACCGDLKVIWSMGVPEEAFTTLFSRTSLRMLESVNLLKDKEARSLVVALLASATARYPSLLTPVVTGVSSLIMASDAGPGVAVDLLEALWHGAGGDLCGKHPTTCPHAATELLREAGRMKDLPTSSTASANTASSGAATSAAGGTKRVAAFVSEASQRVPAAVQTNMAVLLPHLDSEFPSIRSALVTVLGNVLVANVTSTSAPSEIPSPGTLTPRTLMILWEALYERGWDAHASVRACVVKTLTTLVTTKGALTPQQLTSLAKLAVERAGDKAVAVRKSAGILLRNLLLYNPYGSRLDTGAFSQQVLAAEAWLKANAPLAYTAVTGSAATEGSNVGISKAISDSDGEGGAAASLLSHLEDLHEESSEGTEGGNSVAVSQEAAAYVRARAAFIAAREFSTSLGAAIPAMSAMLASKNGSDVMEAIRFLSHARTFGLAGAEAALAEMLVLVWAGGNVKAEVVATFHRLYLLNEAMEEGADGEGEDEDAHFPPQTPAAVMEEAPSKSTVEEERPRPTRAKTVTVAKDTDTTVGGGESDEEEEDEEGVGRKGVAAKKVKRAITSKKAAAAPKRNTSPPALEVDPVVAAENLVSLLSGSSMSVRLSLEETLAECCATGLLPSTLSSVLWDMVGASLGATARGRIDLLTYLAAASGLSPTSIPQDRLEPLATACEGALRRARAALSIISMTTTKSAASSSSTLRFCLETLTPQSFCGAPCGKTVMNGALSALVKGESGSWTPETVRTNFDLLITRGDYRLAKHAAVILLKGENGNVLRDRTGNLQLSDVTSKAGGKKATALAVAAAAAAEEESTQVAGLQAACVNSLCSLLRGDWDGGGDTEISHWYPAAQMGIDAIFHLSPAPIAVLTAVIHAQAAGLTVPRDASSELNAPRLSRLCFTLGHTAVRALAHCEAVASRVKQVRIAVSERGMENKSGAGKAAKEKNAKAGEPNDTMEAQLGGGSALEDEAELELLAQISEKELCEESAGTLGGTFAPILVSIAEKAMATGGGEGGPSETLLTSALLALSKLCACSASLSSVHLQLLFTLLGGYPSPPIRCLLVVALGDLAFRFPNLVEPYQHLLYARLRDCDSGVRKQALMILSHLILNGMVKVKGQVGELAICLNDPDPRISGITKMFFSELSKRGNNPIYNIFPDTLSCLSRLASGASTGSETSGESFAAETQSSLPPSISGSTLTPLDPANFRDIVRFLLSFINKAAQSESLTDKLEHRLEALCTSGTGDVQLKRDLAFCLAQLPSSEKTVKRLADGLKGYRRALGDTVVYSSILECLAKGKRLLGGSGGGVAGNGVNGKAELKDIIEGWEKGLAEARAGGIEDDSALEAAKAATMRARRVAGGVMDDVAATAVADAVSNVAAATTAAAAGGKAKRGVVKGNSSAINAPAPTTTAVGKGLGVQTSAKAAVSKKKKKGVISDSEEEEENSAPLGKVIATSSRGAGNSRSSASASR